MVEGSRWAFSHFWDRFTVWRDQRRESFMGPESTMDRERGLWSELANILVLITPREVAFVDLVSPEAPQEREGLVVDVRGIDFSDITVGR